MNFSEIFIRRPIATSLLMAAIALFGVISYRGLPVSDLPNVDFPSLSVSASLQDMTRFHGTHEYKLARKDGAWQIENVENKPNPAAAIFW